MEWNLEEKVQTVFGKHNIGNKWNNLELYVLYVYYIMIYYITL